MQPKIFLAAAFICAATAARAQVSLADHMLSKHFFITGSCKKKAGQDMLATWAWGNPVPGVGEGPWAKSPIAIVGAVITFSDPPTGMRYAMIGNSASPDPMLWYSHGDSVGATPGFWWPLYYTFPPIGTPGLPHLDLHVGCGLRHWWQFWARDEFRGFVTIKYLPLASTKS